MAEKSNDKKGLFLVGIVVALKETAKGAFAQVSTGENVVSVFLSSKSALPKPSFMQEIAWEIQIGRDGFVSVVG